MKKRMLAAAAAGAMAFTVAGCGSNGGFGTWAWHFTIEAEDGPVECVRADGGGVSCNWDAYNEGGES